MRGRISMESYSTNMVTPAKPKRRSQTQWAGRQDVTDEEAEEREKWIEEMNRACEEALERAGARTRPAPAKESIGIRTEDGDLATRATCLLRACDGTLARSEGTWAGEQSGR